MSKLDGGPAFPVVSEDSAVWDGMSLRDWFAGQALQGLLSERTIFDRKILAARAYELADAMLAERQKSK